jgi:hypothetical protein
LPLNEDADTNAFFAASICCDVGNGTSTLFWLDPWFDGTRLSDLVPKLFAVVVPLVPKLFAVVVPRARKRTVAAVMADQCWIRDITGPLTVPVLSQYLILQQELQAVQLDPEMEDKITWRWT